MNEIWKQSRGAARKAIILGGWAQSLFLFSFVLTLLIPVWGREGVFFFFFWPVSLLLAARAMVQSAAASRQGLWWRPDGGKIFVCLLFGLPVLLLVFCPDADAAALRVSHHLSMETITSMFLAMVHTLPPAPRFTPADRSRA